MMFSTNLYIVGNASFSMLAKGDLSICVDVSIYNPNASLKYPVLFVQVFTSSNLHSSYNLLLFLVYLSFTDRDLVVTSYGLDTGDPIMLSEFLYHEMVAMGQSDQYHELLQLLLLMPPGAPKLWNFLIMGVRRLVSCSISDDDELENSFRIDMNSLVSLLESRAEELGGVYPQVSVLCVNLFERVM